MLRASLTVAACLISAVMARAETPDPRLSGYRVAPGYGLALAATEPMVVNPVTMTWGPDGRLFVVEWQEGRQPANDHIKALKDEDGDGVFDKVDIYMDKLDLPAGIAFWDGWTYITLDHDVVRFHDPDLDGQFDKKEVIASGFGNDDSHHRVSGLVFGPDGWLYMTTGDSDCHAKGSDGSTGTILRSGGVLRCKPDGSKLEVVASGMRNPWGNVAFDDAFRIFHTDNDNEGAVGFTGCRLLHVVEGGDYGWRLREGARCCQPDYERATWNGGRPGRLGWIAETGRGAPAGLCVLNSAAFPPSTRNMLIYPDVFRKLVRAYQLKPKGATFEVAKEFELLASDDGLFRPTDAEIGPDGALYVLDWRTDSGGAGKLSGNGKTGRIYRMTWTGTGEEKALPTMPLDRFKKLGTVQDGELLGDIQTGDYKLRMEASRELIRRINRYLEESQRIKTARGTSPAYKKSLILLTALRQILGYNYGREIENQYKDVTTQARSQSILALKSIGLEWYTTTINREFRSFPDPVQRRILLELLARDVPSEDPTGTRTADFLEPFPNQPPEVVRAFAIASGTQNRLGRSKPGEDPSVQDYLKRLQERSAAIEQIYHKHGYDSSKSLVEQMRKDPKKTQQLAEEIQEVGSKHEIHVSNDLMAVFLLGMALEHRLADPFLRDGITRGLDRLGPAGVDLLLQAIKTDDGEQRSVAIFALQGCRSPEAMAAILDLVDPPAEVKRLPSDATAEFFRTLREFGPAVPPSRVAQFIKKHGQDDPDSTVQALRVLKAMTSTDARDAVRPLVPDLIRSPNGLIADEAIKVAAGTQSDTIQAALLEVVKDGDRPTYQRKMALEGLRGYDAKTVAPVLSTLYGVGRDAAFGSELLRTLAAMDFGSAAKFAERALESSDSTLRGEAIAVLGQKPQTALQVAERFNDNKLPREDLSRVVEAVRGHSSPELQAAIQKLLKNTLLSAPTGAEAAKLRDFVAKNGNPERGRALFLDTQRGNCATCHRIEQTGGSVGPDLTRVWQTLSFDKRVESILEPSKEIKEGYNTFKVATRDGRVSLGLLVSDKADAVILKDAQGREVRIPSSEIEEKANDPTSLMPAGVVGTLSFAELADLLAFLGDQKAQDALKK